MHHPRSSSARHSNKMYVALYVIVLVAVVVTIDVLLFRDRAWLWERLMVNVGIVLVFAAFYLRFMRSR